MEAKLPGFLPWFGAASAHDHQKLLGAGMNWHLFNTIDILQYSTGDTLHLSTAPMINLNIPPMLNNEQIEIAGITFPNYFNDDVVSHGIINNTNIGYIYLYSESEYLNPHPDQQFYQAVNDLRNTDGLIIDLRWNNGGWAFFDDAFNILFNESPLTIEDAYRCGPSTFNLCPFGNASVFQVRGRQPSIYDHPIAVLLGPSCVSMGDITAYRLDYHPMVNQPGQYLNRAEFPIDFPVWHNKEDAANGIDAVVETALSWIHDMSYTYNLHINKIFVRALTDTLTITANVTNPNSHNINVAAIINILDSVFVDSLPMFDDGNHGDSLAGDGFYGCYTNPLSSEEIFTISSSVTDLDSNHYHILPKATRFTTIGPIVVKRFNLDTLIGDYLYFTAIIKNEGLSATAQSIKLTLFSDDSIVTSILNNSQNFGSIAPGDSAVSSNYYIIYTSNIPGSHNFQFDYKISSNNYYYWSDTINVDIINILSDKDGNMPTEFLLMQNYPNPFNPSTTIKYTLPNSEKVKIEVFNLLGQKIETLLNKQMPSGSHEIEFIANDLPSGLYLYRIEAGDPSTGSGQGFQEVRKMILLK